MSDPNNPNIKIRTTPQWSLYQRESFWNANDGKYPIFNTGLSPYLARRKPTDGYLKIRPRLRNSQKKSSRREAGSSQSPETVRRVDEGR